jgi:hypothetical protein
VAASDSDALMEATFPFPNVAGSVLFIRFVVKSKDGELPVITDSLGNTWTIIKHRMYFKKYLGIRAYATDCVPGRNTITVFGSQSNQAKLTMYEIRNEPAIRENKQ